MIDAWLSESETMASASSSSGIRASCAVTNCKSSQRGKSVRATPIAALGPFDLVVNATSAGHDGGAPGIRASWLQADGLCYDMNYSNAAEPLRAACERTGLDYRDGLGMLVGQAAAAFSLWFGAEPPIEAMADAAKHSRAS